MLKLSPLFTQVIGIPIDTNCVRTVADTCLYVQYEKDAMLFLFIEHQANIITTLINTNNLLNIVNNHLPSLVNKNILIN